MSAYRVVTDAVVQVVRAESRDEAARVFAAGEGLTGIGTYDDLVRRIYGWSGWVRVIECEAAEVSR